MKKKQRRLLYILAAILGLFSGLGMAQELKPEVGIKVSWDSNPVVEEVESYLVEWFDGSNSQWTTLANVPHQDSTRLEFATRLLWIKSTLIAGSELCFRVTAVKGADRSEPTDNICDVIPDRFAIDFSELPEVSIVELSTPGSASIEWTE